MIQILDASVAVKWFVVESNNEAALEVLNRVQGDPGGFVVPELFFAEMLAVLSRLASSSKELKEYLSSLQELGFERVGHGRELLEVAAELTIGYQLSGYDAIYLATAKLLRGVWLTADEKAHRKVAKQGWSKLI